MEKIATSGCDILKYLFLFSICILMFDSCKKDNSNVPCGIIGVKPTGLKLVDNINLSYMPYFSINDSVRENVFVDSGSYIVLNSQYGYDTAWSAGTRRQYQPRLWPQAAGWYFGMPIPPPSNNYIISITMYLKYGLTYTSASSWGACTSAWDTIPIHL